MLDAELDSHDNLNGFTQTIFSADMTVPTKQVAKAALEDFAQKCESKYLHVNPEETIETN